MRYPSLVRTSSSALRTSRSPRPTRTFGRRSSRRRTAGRRAPPPPVLFCPGHTQTQTQTDSSMLLQQMLRIAQAAFFPLPPPRTIFMTPLTMRVDQ